MDVLVSKYTYYILSTDWGPCVVLYACKCEESVPISCRSVEWSCAGVVCGTDGPISGGSRGGARGPWPPLNLWQFLDVLSIALTSLAVINVTCITALYVLQCNSSVHVNSFL